MNSTSSQAPTNDVGVAKTTKHLMSLEAFHAITWTGFALCTLAFCGRVAIRIVCFRRPFLEDYLMLASLIILLGACVVIQLCVRYIYMMEDVGNGTTPIPPPTFMDDTTNGLRGFAAFMVMAYTGIWLIKVNFLLFFSRLGGNQFTGYRAFWWAVLVFNIGAGATAIGLIDFPCLLDPAEVIIAQCSGYEKMMASNRASIISCSIDAVGDALIIIFPISILWGTRVSTQKKIILSCLFSLVAFTIAVTIVRGSIFGGVYKSITPDNVRSMNVTWIWFWFALEYIVAFVIACLISFRALFCEKRHEPTTAGRLPPRHAIRIAEGGGGSDTYVAAGGLGSGQPEKEKERGASLSAKLNWRRFHDSVLDTFMTLEGTTQLDRETSGGSGLPSPPSSRLSVDFEQGKGPGWGIYDGTPATIPPGYGGQAVGMAR